MIGRLHILLGLAVVAVLLVMAVPAFGCFPQSTEVTIPSLSDATVRSSTLPANTTSATITATPSRPADTKIFDTLTKTLSAATTRNARVLTCVFLYAGIKENDPQDEHFQLSAPSLQLLFSQMCLELAFKLPQQQDSTPVANPASACPRLSLAVAMRVGSSGRTYHARVKGTTHRPAGRSALVVSCRHVGPGIQIRLRPRSRDRSLRQVVGSTLGIGFFNPSTKRSVRVRTTFSIRLGCPSS